MAQSAAVRPDPSFQRKAAIAQGAALDHSGSVQVQPIPDFDLNHTIFQTLEGKAARFIMKTRVGKEVSWSSEASAGIQDAYQRAQSDVTLPEISPELLTFMVEQCDFDVEHADGSFLDHLYFCFEYTQHHYPEGSPLVMLLHSILGTGTNTFAMEADKIPALEALLSPEDWAQIEAFPSVLRLLYHGPLRQELRQRVGSWEQLQSIRMHRVIDNAALELSGEAFWVAMNYQLIHLVDFLPVSNWSVHQNDTSFILFRDLYDLMQQGGRLDAKIDYAPAGARGSLQDEEMSFLGKLATRLPLGLVEKLAGKSVARFSERIGHSLDYEARWS